MEPIGVSLSRQTLVDKCGSWPHRRQVAAGWAQACKTIDLPLIPLLCQGQWDHGVGFAQMKHLELPGVSILQAKGLREQQLQ